jgi:hypothetical protein
MIMNSLLTTYIIVFLAAFNLRIGLLESLPKALSLNKRRYNYTQRYNINQARTDLLIYGIGFALRFIATWGLLLFITEVVGLKINGVGSLFFWGVPFVLVVSLLSRFISRVEEINIFKDYRFWGGGYNPFTEHEYTDLVYAAWFIPWGLALVLWLLFFGTILFVVAVRCT